MNELIKVIMKTIKKMNTTMRITAIVVIIILLGFVSAVFQPDIFGLDRAILIVSPQSKIYDQVNDFHNWQGWFPWEQNDPTVKRTFEGPDSGVGSVYHCSGKLGEATMTITDSKPDSDILIKWEMSRPLQTSGTTEFTFDKSVNKQTYVAWKLSGRSNFMIKLSLLFVNLNKTVGDDLQNGLEGLKVLTQPGYKR